MTSTYEEFYQFADRLDVDSGEEIQLRMAIGRMYYGTFHFVRASDRSVPDKHEKMQKHFIDSGNNTLGNRLRSYHALRVKADYKLNETVSYSDLKSARRYRNAIQAEFE